MVGGPTCFSRDDAAKIEFIDKNIDHPYRVGVRHIVIQALGKQRVLTSMLSLDKTLHRHRPCCDLNPSHHNKVDANVLHSLGQKQSLENDYEFKGCSHPDNCFVRLVRRLGFRHVRRSSAMLFVCYEDMSPCQQPQSFYLGSELT
ncbi:hypothetical protein FQZ97_1030530 [compost metagenome]